MKISIIGAGAIGSATARLLAARDAVEEIRVCDAGSRSLKSLHATVESQKVRSYQVDGRDESVLKPIIRNSDCIVGCADPTVNSLLASIAIELGSHFCDVGGSDETVRSELALNDTARESGVWIVPNCGLAPGLINVLCLLGVDAFDEVESACLRVGDVPLDPEPPFNFRLSVSARKLIDDYSRPVHIIRDGEVREISPLTNDEEIWFGEPFGKMEAFATAGSLSTLTDELRDRVRYLDMKTIRWPGHADRMRFLLGLGFGEKKIIDVRTHLTYNDVLVRRMHRMLGGEYADAVLLRAATTGLVKGTQRTLVYEMVDMFDDSDGMSAMRRCTSIPIAVAAYLLASGSLEGGGAAPMERAFPRRSLYDELVNQGLGLKSKWYDGYCRVNDPENAHV